MSQPTPATPAQLDARAQFLATHLVAVAHLYVIAQLKLSHCI